MNSTRGSFTITTLVDRIFDEGGFIMSQISNFKIPACKCLDKLLESLKSIDPEVYWSNTVFNFHGVEGYLPLEYTYSQKKTNGLYKKHKSKGYLLFGFCPFCGKKFNLANSKGEVVG